MSPWVLMAVSTGEEPESSHPLDAAMRRVGVGVDGGGGAVVDPYDWILADVSDTEMVDDAAEDPYQ